MVTTTRGERGQDKQVDSDWHAEQCHRNYDEFSQITSIHQSGDITWYDGKKKELSQ